MRNELLITILAFQLEILEVLYISVHFTANKNFPRNGVELKLLLQTD